MIIAGWILAVIGLAQVVFAGTIDVTQLIEGNRVLGIAPSVIANADLVAQRAMIHQSGCATFLAGAIFLAAAYLKPAPEGARQRAWSSIGAIAAGSLALGACIGFGLFLYALHVKNADQRLVDQIRLKGAGAASSAKLWDEADRRARNQAEAAAASKNLQATPPASSAGPD